MTVHVRGGRPPRFSLSFLCGASVFLIYLLYLCPAVYNGDSPLLYTAAFSMGPAHPPGYPLYIQLGKTSTFPPLASTAWKMNLFSAVCGTLAAVLVFKSAYLIAGDKAASVFSALLSAFLPLSWLESTKAEVYTLNAALAMAVFYLGLRFIKEADRRMLYIASFLMGIGMGNHQTIGFMAFPLLFAFFVGVKEKRASAAIVSTAFLLTGMGVYMFGCLRSLKYPDGLLFAYSYSGTLKDFLSVFFREDYGSSIPTLAAPAGNPLSFLRGAFNTAKYILWDNMGGLSLLIVPGLIGLWKKKTVFFFGILSLASYWVVLSAMVFAFKEPVEKDIFILSPYMQAVLYLSAVFAGCGLSFITGPVKRRWGATAKPIAVGMVFLPLVFILPGTLKTSDLSDYYLTEDFTNNLLESLPPVSVVITDSDASYFSVFYKTLIERKKEDAIVLLADKEGIIAQAVPAWKYKALYPGLGKRKLFPVGPDGQEPERAYEKKGRLFAFDIMNLSEKLRTHFTAVPYIQSYRLFPKEYGAEGALIDADFKKAFGRFVYERALRDRSDDIFSQELKMFYFIPLSHYAYLMKEQGDTARSRELYEAGLKLITPNGLVYYMDYLSLTGRKAEMVSFLQAIKPYAEKYEEVRLLRQALAEQFLMP